MSVAIVVAINNCTCGIGLVRFAVAQKLVCVFCRSKLCLATVGRDRDKISIALAIHSVNRSYELKTLVLDIKFSVVPRFVVNSIHVYTCFGRCGFQPHLRDCINTGSVRKPNLPQCINYYWIYYKVERADGV